MAEQRTERIKLAASMYHQGQSFRAIGDELKLSAATICRWAKEEPAWKQQWEALESKAREQREQIFLSQSELVEATSKRLGEFCLENLESAIKTQKAIAKALENISLPEKITDFEQLAIAAKVLKDLSAMVSQTWVNFELAAELEEFFQHNSQSPQIDFQEYSESELEEIRQQN